MKRDKSQRYGIVRIFLKLTPHIIRCAPWSFAGAQCGMASYGIILGLTTVITQRFFDAATVYSNGFRQKQVIFLLAVLVVIHIFSQILNGATYVFLEALVQRIDGRLSMKHHEKMGRIAPEKFEDTQMLDFLNKAKQGKSNSIWFVLSIFLVFTYYLPYYAVMSVYLSSVRPVLSVSLLLVFLPTVFTQFLRAKLYAKLEDNTAPVRREISVGMFAAVFSSVGFMFSFMEELVNGHFGALVRNYGTVRNYLDFMEMPVPEKTGGKIAADTDIFLDHVSFTYPGTDRRAVSDVSLHIRTGETVAVVGENGSGKSTLIRLITGLYTPEQGSVSYGNDGKKKFKAAQKGISAVFQKYARYQMTLRENISISDTEAEYEDDFLEKCCEKAGVESGSEIFPSGYETLLSREFGGVDLSGGQWQRIAIARGFFRKHQLIVLDEPTAAIDPIEETRIYDRFAQMAKEKTAIIVTHRLGSVKLADRVFVMKDGRLVEEGTHEELMRLNGEYARLYRTQEKWYVAV